MRKVCFVPFALKMITKATENRVLMKILIQQFRGTNFLILNRH